ncbi:hypothetical protein HanIR_Chr16g0833331 [Helianthus annuus]|nr:hypothetical protein HanIR_Chr16g0833331 [Helianthus annuus]
MLTSHLIKRIFERKTYSQTKHDILFPSIISLGKTFKFCSDVRFYVFPSLHQVIKTTGLGYGRVFECMEKTLGINVLD